MQLWKIFNLQEEMQWKSDFLKNVEYSFIPSVSLPYC